MTASKRTTARATARPSERVASGREFMTDPDRDSDGLLSDEEYLQQIRSESVQERLPQFKASEGWHYIWLSVTSTSDPIHQRMRLGYSPVAFNEINATNTPGLETFKATTGEFTGSVTCNEMILFKITERKYQLLMREYHDLAPTREEEAVKTQVLNGPKGTAAEDSEGRRLLEADVEDDGFKRMGRKYQAPAFA